MSKSEEKTATGDALNQNTQYNQNAQSSYTAAQGDVGNYENELSQYAASNPFTPGGAYQTAQNEQLADTAAGGAQGAAQAAQSAAVRSGENPAAAIAAGEQVDEANTRAQMGDVAAANQSRISQGAQYGQNVLNATAVPEQMEATLSGQQSGAANSALGEEVKGAETPSYLDELINSGITAGSAIGQAYAKPGCWIAARLFGGWLNPRTVLVRLWLNYCFGLRWYGKPVLWLYGFLGQRIADRWMPRSKVLTSMMRGLFRSALRKAIVWGATGDGKLLVNEHRILLRMSGITAPVVNEKATADRLIAFARYAVPDLDTPSAFKVTVTAPREVR